MTPCMTQSIRQSCFDWRGSFERADTWSEPLASYLAAHDALLGK